MNKKIIVSKIVEVGEYLMMVEIVDGVRRGFLFQDGTPPHGDENIRVFQPGCGTFFPRNFAGSVPKEIGMALRGKEVDTYCIWGPDSLAFGVYSLSDFDFSLSGLPPGY